MAVFINHRMLTPVHFETAGLMRILTFGILFLWLMVGGGCSSLSPVAEQTQWRCQAEADAAVSRGDWETALTMHQAFLIHAPDNCLAIYHLGYIKGKVGDRSSEAAQYERAFKCGYDRDDRLLYNLGMAYGDLGRTREAVVAFESAVRINDANADNHFGLGLMHQTAGQYDMAVSAFSRVLSLDAGYWEARLALSRILLDQGRLKAARSHLDTLARTIPDNADVRLLWRLYRQRSTMLYER